MRPSSLGCHALLCVSLFATGLPTAHAQGAPSPDATGPHRVDLRAAEPVAAFRVQDARGRAVLERCENPCSQLLPGTRLRVDLLDTEGESLGARNVHLEQDSALLFEAPDGATRKIGLALFVTGAAAVVVGSVLFMTNFGGHGGASADDAGPAGVWAALGGGVLIAVGAPMFFGNLRPDMTVTPY